MGFKWPSLIKKRLLAGFSLIELMTVLSIITILAVTAVISYRDYTIRSTVASLLPLAEKAKHDVEEAHNQGLLFGTTGNEVYVDNASDDKPFGLYDVIRTDYGCVNIAIDLAALNLEATNELIMVLCPTTDNGSIEWRCGHTSTSTAEYLTYLPSACQADTNNDIADTSY